MPIWKELHKLDDLLSNRDGRYLINENVFCRFYQFDLCVFAIIMTTSALQSFIFAFDNHKFRWGEKERKKKNEKKKNDNEKGKDL